MASFLLFLIATGSLAAATCAFTPAFKRPHRGAKKVQVYQGLAEPTSGNAAPLAFISELEVNTDGTRISYKVDDPHASHGAINDIRYALNPGMTAADFLKVAKQNWEPLDQTWRVLSPSVIERDSKTGKPCIGPDNYLVSMTADVSRAGAFDRQGDCDQTKWIDALTIPALVLPSNSQFQKLDAKTRNFVVVMTLESPTRFAYGIVGDTGPEDKIGEASVEMNRILNGLPPGSVPSGGQDAIDRFQGPRSLILIFPGPQNRLPYPVTPDRVANQAKARFEAWGGEARMSACAAELAGSH